MDLCINAHDPARWFCYHYAGRITPGKGRLINGKCEACEIATPPYEEEPSFLKGTED